MSLDAMGVPVFYNVTCTLANHEYSQALPNQAREITVQNRSSNPLRISFIAGQVETPTDPFLTIKAGAVYNSPIDVRCSGIVLYFASASAGDVVEIEVWT